MSDTKAPTDVVVLTINGKPVEAAPGELVIEAAERAGTYIPRFCYHPRMEPVGMCRMCVVDIDTGRGPALQPACMIPVAPEMVVDTESAATKKAQDGVLEFLLVNHPLDCPVCDKGGECPLQDQTMSYGPGESRFVEEKRHFEKPIPISDLVALDRERCILCDRCTRFAKDVAGDTLIHFQDRGNQTQVNTFPDHPFASYFSGNTVQICPVGALTASPYRFKARPWDLDQVESTCAGCSVGCRIVVQSSRNEILRYQGVDIDPVNWGWLCDKGRFAFQSVNSEERLGAPLVRAGRRAHGRAVGRRALPGGCGHPGRGRARSRRGASAAPASPTRTPTRWAKLAEGRHRHGPRRRAAGRRPPRRAGAWPAPRHDRRDLRQGRHGAPARAGPQGGAARPVPAAPPRGGQRRRDRRRARPAAHVGVRAGRRLPPAPPRRRRARSSPRCWPAAGDREVGGIEPAGPRRGRGALLDAGPVTVILGRPSVGESADGVVAAANAIHAAHPEVRFLSALRRGNVHGALDMGLSPGLLPGRVRLGDSAGWYPTAAGPRSPRQTGLDATGILEAAAAGQDRRARAPRRRPAVRLPRPGPRHAVAWPAPARSSPWTGS